MVQYEVALVVRAVSKQDLSKLLRGVCRTVLDKNGVLRKLENLGVREIPHKMRVHNEQFELGRYMVMRMDSSPQSAISIRNKFRSNTDVLRATVLKA